MFHIAFDLAKVIENVQFCSCLNMGRVSNPKSRKGKRKVGGIRLKRVAAGAHLPTSGVLSLRNVQTIEPELEKKEPHIKRLEINAVVELSVTASQNGEQENRLLSVERLDHGRNHCFQTTQ